MLKHFINEEELSKTLKRVELSLMNHIISAKNRDNEFYQTHGFSFNTIPNIPYNINFSIDLFDKHYKGIKNCTLSWIWPETITYDQILKIYNITSEKERLTLYNLKFFHRLIFDFIDYNVNEYTVERLDPFHSKGLLRYRIPSSKENILLDFENFFRRTHKMMCENIYLIEKVEDFY